MYLDVIKSGYERISHGRSGQKRFGPGSLELLLCSEKMGHVRPGGDPEQT